MYKLFAVTSLAVLSAGTAIAMPEFAEREKKQCAYCHVNPAGGGTRNYRGRYYAAHQFSFKGFVDLGPKMGVLKEVWRETVAENTVAVDSFPIRDNNHLVVVTSDGKTGKLSVQTWDGEKFNADAVQDFPPSKGAVVAFPDADRSRTATIIAGASRFSYQQGKLAMAASPANTSETPLQVVGRAGIKAVASSATGEALTATGTTAISVDLTEDKVPSSLEDFKKRGYQRMSTLYVGKYIPPVWYAQKSRQLVAVSADADNPEPWKGPQFEGDILDLKTGDPRNEGKQTLLVLLKPKTGNPVLIAMRSE